MRRDFQGNINELTTLRFPFCFLIVIYHFTNYFSDYEQTGFVMMENLAFVLDFFFILSGFVMAHVYADQSRFRYGKYILRRFMRIYPLHLLTFLSLVVIAFVGGAFGIEASNPERYNLDTAWLHLTMLHAWLPEPIITFNVPSWSVSAEWFVYLLLPLFMYFSRMIPPLRLLLISAAAVIVWYFATLIVTGYSFPDLEGYALVRVFVDFFVGYSLRVYLRNHSLPFTGFRYASRYFAIAMGVTGVLAFPQIISLIIFVWFLAASFERALKGQKDSYFDSPFWMKLGDTAFSLYITHMPFAIYATNLIGFTTDVELPGSSENPVVFGIFLALLLGAILAAWAIHILIEQPMALMGPRFIENTYARMKSRLVRA